MKLLLPLASLAALPSLLAAAPGVATDKQESVPAKSGPAALIVGGEEAPVNRYPWFARWENGQCGGSLISRQYVLTAAHCLDGRGFHFLDNFAMQIGAFERPFGNGTDNQAQNGGQMIQTLKVVAHHLHPDYEDDDYNYDVALLKLETTVDPSVTSPVPIDGHDGSSVVEDYGADKTGLFAVGLGSRHLITDYDYYDYDPDLFQKALMHVGLDFVTQEQCRAIYRPLGYGTEYTDITDEMMCAGAEGKDSGVGDSGGPLWDEDEKVQVGVVSWAHGTPNIPGVYARISTVIDWIQKTVCDSTDDRDADPFCEGVPTPRPTVSFAPTTTFLPTTSIPTFFPTRNPTMNPTTSKCGKTNKRGKAKQGKRGKTCKTQVKANPFD